jgi:hypothetical protein
MVASVSDAVSGGIAGNVTCPGSFPQSVAAKQTLHCTYTAALPDAQSRVNTATAVSGTANVGNGSGTAPVTFGDPTSLVDECVDVTDDNATPSDVSDDVHWTNICADTTLAFARDFGRYSNPEGCGEHVVTNTASFLSVDGGDSGADGHTVTVTVPCPTGCTLTQGYWKTHSQEGPAPYDDN